MSNNYKIEFIDKTSDEDRINLFCPLCNYLLIASYDIDNVRKNKCCEECWLTFGQMRQKEWKEGWRPDSETLNRYKQVRRIINKDIKKILGE